MDDFAVSPILIFLQNIPVKENLRLWIALSPINHDLTILFSIHSKGLANLSLVLVGGNAYEYSISQEICTRILLCCGYTLTDFPVSIRLTSLALWQSNDCPSASKATLMNMDKYFMWIHYERLHNHNKAKHNKTVCIFLGIYCTHTRVSWDIGFIRFVQFRKSSNILRIILCYQASDWNIYSKNDLSTQVQCGSRVMRSNVGKRCAFQ